MSNNSKPKGKPMRLNIHPGQNLPSTPENLRWNSPAHILSLGGVHMRIQGQRLLYNTHNTRAEVFTLAPYLPRGTAPEALYTAMLLTVAFTNSSVREYGTPLLRGFIQDAAGWEEGELESVLQEIHGEALAHQEEVSVTDQLTMLSYVMAFEHVIRSGGRGQFPATTNVIEELLFRGQRVEMYSEHDVKWMHRSSPLTEYMERHMQRNGDGVGYAEYSTHIHPSFEEQYWQAMEEGYIQHLKQSMMSVNEAFTQADFLLSTPLIIIQKPFHESMEDRALETLAAWGFILDGMDPFRVSREKLRAAWELPKRLTLMVAMLEDADVTLGDNLTRISSESLDELSALVEEYNVEWALAAFEWDRYEENPGPLPPEPMGKSRGSW